MAFMKYARASIVHPQVTGQGWAKVRTAAKATADVSDNLINRAAGIFGKPFDPKDYLLTHATIVASVDTFEPPNTKLGSFSEGGFRVNRKYGNFRVKLGCDKFINNNLDCWDRGVLLKAYKTFIGGHNFVEHVQVEELSKGRIIDAVARDLGESVYVDILIATDRKHTDLVTAITSGKMSTLSMGCTVDGTICTKCGHWAADETEMCPHIKYEKGNVFFDDQGRQHRVAELCGHESLDPTGGVQFVEGSWVGTPAFTGAVLRNIIEVSPDSAIARQAAAILSQPPEEWSPATYRKAASLATTFMAGWGDEEGGGEGEGEAAPAAPAAPAKGPFDDLEQELTTHLTDRIRKKIKKDMDSGNVEQALSPETPASTNEGLVKEGHQMDELVADRHQRVSYGGALSVLCRTASSEADLMNRVAVLNGDFGVSIPVPLYRAALRLGSFEGYTSEPQFVRACQAVLGKAPTPAEVNTLIRLGKLISRRCQDRRGNKTPLAVATVKEN